MEDKTVSTVTLRTVRAGLEDEFEKSLRDFFDRSRTVPGQLGIHVVRPMADSGSREWGILRTFCDDDARSNFFSSQVFLDWEADAARFTEGDRRQEKLTGLETWFSLPGSKSMVPPPRWKMALVSTLAGTLSGTALNLLASQWLPPMAPFLRTLLMSVSIASLMTWVLMPFLSKLLKNWLFKQK